MSEQFDTIELTHYTDEGGNLYRALHLARDTVTGDDVVVYINVTTSKVFVTPASVWRSIMIKTNA
jgi:hypothetical protein